MRLKKIKNIVLSCLLAAGCMLSLTACGKAPAGNVAEEITLADGDKIADIVIEDYGTISVKLFPDLAPNAVDNFIKLAESGYYDGLKIHYVAKDECIRGGSLNGDGTGGTALINDDGQFGVETHEDARNFYGAVGYVADQYGYNTTTFYMVNNKKVDDITKYSADLIKNEATLYADQKESLEEGDPLLEYLTYQETYYTNLADMIGKASDDVVKKYAEKGGNPLWDGGFTVFGQIYAGFDVLDKLSGVDVVMGREGNKTKPKTDIIIESVTIIEYKTPEEAAES
ncbi:MAG: peptidylprolyl isomerase [Oscillospiraceae bacterium]|nr:peptidylprolyl isomerase [Oscillospiraceae bacterium]